MSKRLSLQWSFCFLTPATNLPYKDIIHQYQLPFGPAQKQYNSFWKHISLGLSANTYVWFVPQEETWTGQKPLQMYRLVPEVGIVFES